MSTYCYTIEPVKVHHIEVQAVQIHYDKVVDRATEMITRYEGLALEAYLDRSGRYSIGYGTRSFKGEVITQQEAWARMEAVVGQSVRKVMRDFPNATENQIVALTSLFYNCGSGYKRVKKHGMKVYMTPGFCEPKGYGGLKKRRAEERALIFGS